MTIPLELPDDFYDHLERQAKTEGRPVQDLIRLAVEEYIKRKQRPTKQPRPPTY